MCGIAGIVSLDGAPVQREELERMTALLHHRGPDARGHWIDGAVGLGHTRLAVIDLEGGVQPMASGDGALHLTFNGEIYNHKALRRRLGEGCVFRTRSDTEALLHLYQERGPELVHELSGFFAFAIWDGPNQRLTLARDRLGKKPLFYAESKGRLLFASELRSVAALLPERRPDPVALDEVLALRYVAGSRSGLEGVRKLLPGEVLVLERGALRTWRYWEPPAPDPEPIAPEEAVESLRERLDRAVAARLEADVPLGLLLSGGLDSTALLESLARIKSEPVHTFTVAFSREKESEGEHARAAAEYFGAHHQEFQLGEEELLAHVEGVLTHADEPFADPSLLPTTLVSGLARQHVTVCLGGDGGDELFGGYARYARLLSDAHRPPTTGARASLYRHLAQGLPRLFGKSARLANRLAASLATPEGRYALSLVSVEAPLRARLHGTRLREAGLEPGAIETRLTDELHGAGPIAGRAMAHDLGHFLPGLILTKVDRASMACSLEMRAPFLDHELVEWAARLPIALKIDGGTGKVLVRRMLEGRVPPALLARGKKGFGTPLGRWFRRELLSFAREHLEQSRLAADGWLDGGTVRAMLRAHVAHRRNLGEALWTLLALELWYRNHVLPRSA